MKKLLPFAALCAAVILIVPILAIGGKSGDTPVKQAVEFVQNAIDTEPKPPLTYKILNHKTDEVMELTPLEYITGVVAAEMPISFNKEALSAQAIAAHTYALRQIDAEMKDPDPTLKGAYLTTDFERHQAYMSDDELKTLWGDMYAVNKKKLDEAVAPVIDLILAVDNKPIIAAFHSLNAGQTESAENVWGQAVPYLTAVKSEGDTLSPKLTQTVVLTADEVSNAIKQVYPDVQLEADCGQWFAILERTPSGTVSQLKVGDMTLSGKEVREQLGLKSACFELAYEDENFTFTTKGYGHAVGMSQYGADFLGRQGQTYKEILAHYYPDTALQNISGLYEVNE